MQKALSPKVLYEHLRRVILASVVVQSLVFPGDVCRESIVFHSAQNTHNNFCMV